MTKCCARDTESIKKMNGSTPQVRELYALASLSTPLCHCSGIRLDQRRALPVQSSNVKPRRKFLTKLIVRWLVYLSFKLLLSVQVSGLAFKD